MEPVVLFRKGYEQEEEFNIAKEYFRVVEYRSEIPANSLVIPRYSALPFYKELEVDVTNLGSTLINSHIGHLWIADFDYYHDLKGYTPRSWTESEFAYCDEEGPFVLKGLTNSRKFRWNTHMFAETKRQAVAIGAELMQDPLISQQGIIYRKYIPLKTFEIGINGLPFTNEFRFFFYKETILAYGFYWSTMENLELGKISDEGIQLAKDVAKIASQHVDFFVLDVAEKQEGGWILIEINDGQMSGLSEINPHVLYSSLNETLNGQVS